MNAHPMKHLIPLLALALTTSSFAGPANSAISNPPPPAPDATAFCGQRPSKSIFGGYTSINRSIRSGQTSITHDQIVSYGPANLEKFQGDYYWALPVTLANVAKAPHHYAGKPLSDGIHITQARALVKAGNVVHWLYQPTHPERSSIPVR